MFAWKGKTAVITGASSGIGASILIDLAKLGVNVIGIGRRKDRIEALAAKNKDAKGKIHVLECDVSNPKSIQAAFDWIEANIGNINIWINNAGTWRSNQLTSDNLKDEEIIETINTNFTGLALCCRKAVKLIERTGEDGYVINIGSLAGQISASMSQANFGTNVYAGTKHAVANLTDVLRLELASKPGNKIRVSVSEQVYECLKILKTLCLPIECQSWCS